MSDRVGRTGLRRLLPFLRERSLRPAKVVSELRLPVRLGILALILASLSLVLPSNTWLGAEPVVNARVDSMSRAVIALMFAVLALAVWSLGSLAIHMAYPRLALCVLTVVACSLVARAVAGNWHRDDDLVLINQNTPSWDWGVENLPGWVAPVVGASILVGSVSLALPYRMIQARPGLVGFAISVPLWCSGMLWLILPRTPVEIPEPLLVDRDQTVVEILEAAAASLALAPVVFASLLGVYATFRILALLSARELGDAHVRLSRGAAQWIPYGRGLLCLLVVAKIGILTAAYFGALFPDSQQFRTLHWSQLVGAAPFVAFGAFALHRARSGGLPLGATRRFLGLFIGILAIPSIVFLTAGLGELVVAAVRPWGKVHPLALVVDNLPWMAQYSFLAAVSVIGVAGVWSARRSGLTAGAVLAIGAAVWGLPSALQAAFGSGADPLTSIVGLDVVVTVLVGVIAVSRPITGQTQRLLVVVLLCTSLLTIGVDVLVPAAVAVGAFVYFLIAPVAWRFLVDTVDDRLRPAWRAVAAMPLWALLLASSGAALVLASERSEWDSANRLQWQLVVVPVILLWLCAPHAEGRAATTGVGWRDGPSLQVGTRTDARVPRILSALLGAAIVTSFVLGVAQGDASENRPPHQVSLRTPSPEWQIFNCQPPSQDDQAPSFDGEIAFAVPIDTATDAFVIAGHGSQPAIRELLKSCPTVSDVLLEHLDMPECSTSETNDRLAGIDVATTDDARQFLVCGHQEEAGRDTFVVGRTPTEAGVTFRTDVEEILASLRFTSPAGTASSSLTAFPSSL